MDVLEAFTDAEQRRVDLIAQRATIDAELADLDREIDGLRLTIKRLGLSLPEAAAAEEPVPGVVNGWQAKYRTDAILDVLAEAPRPMTPPEILRHLVAKGREDDTRDLVSAALAHLKKQGKADNIRRGLWVAVEPQTQDDPAATGSVSHLNPYRLGGDANDGDRARDHHRAAIDA